MPKQKGFKETLGLGFRGLGFGPIPHPVMGSSRDYVGILRPSELHNIKGDYLNHDLNRFEHLKPDELGAWTL